jgi:hypothetical protein
MYEHLKTLGFSVRVVGDPGGDVSPDEEVWILGTPTWFPRTCRHLVAREPSQRPFTLIQVSEPLLPPSSAGLRRPVPHLREITKVMLRDSRVSDAYSNERSLRRLVREGIPDVLVVTSRDRQARLAELGISSEVVPLGCGPWLTQDLGLERDIDVLFLGSLVIPRRRRALRHLRRAGLDVLALGGYGKSGVWGEERVRLLNRTKILLNILRFPGAPTLLRLTMGMGNGTLVVSEPLVDPYPYVPGEHFVSASLDEMPAVVARYLADDQERLPIARAGQRMAMEEVTETRGAAQILTLCDLARARSEATASPPGT